MEEISKCDGDERNSGGCNSGERCGSPKQVAPLTYEMAQMLDTLSRDRAHARMREIECDLMTQLCELHNANSHSHEFQNRLYIARKIAKNLDCLAAALNNLHRG